MFIYIKDKTQLDPIDIYLENVHKIKIKKIKILYKINNKKFKTGKLEL